MERAKALWALTRRITGDSFTDFVELLEQDDNNLPLMFGTMPINHSAIIALLLNSPSDLEAKAREVWFGLPAVDRYYLKNYLKEDSFDLPTLAIEEVALDQAVAVANDRLGAAEWIARPLHGVAGSEVLEVDPGKRSMFVAPDGSALLVPIGESTSELLEAFGNGVRSSDEDFERERASSTG